MTKRNRYKIFIDSDLKFHVIPITNVSKFEYYSFLKKMKREGLTQFLFTSRLTINLLIQLLSENNIEITNIELYDNDDDTSKRLKKIFNDFKEKRITEKEIHKLLDYLENDYSIDIKNVKLRNVIENYGPLNLFVNGIFENSSDNYWNNTLLKALNTVWDK